MSGTKPRRSKHSLDAVHFDIALWPFRDNTQVAVNLVVGVANNAARTRVWSGYLPCRRVDLAGLTAAECVALLCSQLAALPDLYDRPADTSTAGGPGAPLGATGGLENLPLPGL